MADDHELMHSAETDCIREREKIIRQHKQWKVMLQNAPTNLSELGECHLQGHLLHFTIQSIEGLLNLEKELAKASNKVMLRCHKFLKILHHFLQNYRRCLLFQLTWRSSYYYSCSPHTLLILLWPLLPLSSLFYKHPLWLHFTTTDSSSPTLLSTHFHWFLLWTSHFFLLWEYSVTLNFQLERI